MKYFLLFAVVLVSLPTGSHSQLITKTANCVKNLNATIFSTLDTAVNTAIQGGAEWTEDAQNVINDYRNDINNILTKFIQDTEALQSSPLLHQLTAVSASLIELNIELIERTALLADPFLGSTGGLISGIAATMIASIPKYTATLTQCALAPN